LEAADLGAEQHQVQDLPAETLLFLLGSRYCETDRLSELAWALFGMTPLGWARVQAVWDFVHDHVAFGYEHSRATRTAADVYEERQGVCRDYAHLALTFCRCLNIPARYCTGYVSDIGLPPPHAPMDFRRLDRGLSRRPVAQLRSSQQRSADRPNLDRARSRRR
jgi:transglutaminase-like putative cysteine protease